MEREPDSSPRGSTPVPDPTILTTQQLYREIAASREIIEANVGQIKTRLDAMDTATELNKNATDRIPALICEKVSALEKLHNEKFAGVEKQFAERDTRTEQTRASDQKAVDAALQAQKEAAGATNESAKEANTKTEQNFTKLLDQIGERVNELKTRLDRGEGQKIQSVETKGQQNWFVSLFVIGGLTLVSIIISVLALIQMHPH